MRCYAFVLAPMYRYSWLITFEIFQNFFFLDRGVGGVYRIQFLFFIFIFFLYLQGPLGDGALVSYHHLVEYKIQEALFNVGF